MNSLNSEITKSSHCVYSKNLLSHLDGDLESENHKKFVKHTETCSTCLNKWQEITHLNKALKVFVPKAQIDHDLKETFEREVGELFKIFNLNPRVVVKNKIINNISLMNQFGESLLSNVFSKTMLKTYVLAAVFYMAIKFFN